MSFKKILAAVLTSGLMLSFIPTVSMAASTGWSKDSDGNWHYYSSEDGFVKNEWKEIDGKKYYFFYDGVMACNVNNLSINDIEYDFDSSGACLNPEGRKPEKEGWYKRVYYQHKNFYDEDTNKSYGKVTYVTYWYYYNSDLSPYTGWYKESGKWYFFNKYELCRMTTGRCYIDGDYYMFNGNGEMVKGWYKYFGQWYYAKSNGVLANDEWLVLGGKHYYFRVDSCTMIADAKSVEFNEKCYDFDKDGACIDPDGYDPVSSGWKKKYVEGDRYLWQYLDQDGNPLKGWQKIGGKWYYFYKESGYMLFNGFTSGDGKIYFCKENGEMLSNGWYHSESGWIYARSNGALYNKEWLNVGGKWYYFDKECMMIHDYESYTIAGVQYSFDSNGVCLNPYGGAAPKKSGWYYTKVDKYYNEGWVYYDSDGAMYKEQWLKYNGQWYYFDDVGLMVSNRVYKIDDKFYDFDLNGVCVNPYSPRDYDKNYVS